MKILLLLTLSIFTFASDFNGIWVGNGAAKSGDFKVSCPDVEMRFHVTDTLFILRGGHYNCEGFSAEYPYFEFQINQGVLYDGSKEVGSISDRLINIFSKEEGFNLDLVLENGELSMFEIWEDGDEYFKVIAKLKK